MSTSEGAGAAPRRKQTKIYGITAVPVGDGFMMLCIVYDDGSRSPLAAVLEKPLREIDGVRQATMRYVEDLVKAILEDGVDGPVEVSTFELPVGRVQ